MSDGVQVALIIVGGMTVLGVIITAAVAFFSGGDNTVFTRWLAERALVSKAEAKIKEAEALHKDRCPRINDNPKEKP